MVFVSMEIGRGLKRKKRKIVTLTVQFSWVGGFQLFERKGEGMLGSARMWIVEAERPTYQKQQLTNTDSSSSGVLGKSKQI